MSVYQFRHIAANGTTVIHSRACTLRRLTINSNGATGNTATIYNNTAGSGDVVAVIDTTKVAVGYYDFDVALPAGLTVVMATGTAGDLTVISEGPGA